MKKGIISNVKKMRNSGNYNYDDDEPSFIW